MIRIAPSILSADFSSIKEEFVKLKEAKVDYIHFDVMDNHFVPNLTFGPKFIKDLRKHSDMIFDVHLMIESPEKWVDQFLETGGDNFTFHVESTNNIMELAKKVKGQDKLFSLSVKPNTPIETVFPYLDHVYMILVMTVEPGFGGQELIQNTLPKISRLKDKITSEGLNTLIQVDGGVNLSTLPLVIERGADIMVMGSAFFKSENYKTLIDKVKEISKVTTPEKINI